MAVLFRERLYELRKQFTKLLPFSFPFVSDSMHVNCSTRLSILTELGDIVIDTIANILNARLIEVTTVCIYNIDRYHLLW